MPQFTTRPLSERMDHRRAFPLALVAATALAAAGCGSTASKPAAENAQSESTATATTQAVTAAPVAAPQTFTSQRYRFRVTLPNDWSEHDATEAWNGKKLEGTGSSAFANFADPAGRTLVAA